MLSPRTITLYIFLLLMEVLAGFTVVVGSGLLDSTSIGYGLFWFFLVAGAWGIVTGLLTGHGIRSRLLHITALLLSGAFISVLWAAIISRSLLAFLDAAFLLGLAYWRGLAITEEPPVHEEIQRRFTFDFGLLFLGIIWVIARGIIDRPSIWGMLALTGIAYIVVSMLALGTSRISTERTPGAMQALTVSLLVQLGILVVASLIALQIFAIDMTGWIGNVLHPFFALLGAILNLIVGVILLPISWLAGLIHPHHHATPSVGQLGNINEHGNAKPIKHKHPNTGPVVISGAVFVILVLLAVAWLIARILPRITPRRQETGFTEERESLLSWQAFIDLLRQALAALLRRGKGLAADTVEVSRRRIFGPEYPDDPVRRLYARMLRRAAVNGKPRGKAVTPQEYQRTLIRVWPATRADVQALTSAYIDRRYGEVSPRPDRMALLQERWEHIRTTMRRVTTPIASAEAPPPGKTPPPPVSTLPAQLVDHLKALDLSPRAIVRASATRKMGIELGIWAVALLTPIALLVGILLFLIYSSP